MTETPNTEDQLPTGPDPQDEADELAQARAESRPQLELVDAPADAPEGTGTGYAVFDRTIGQYVPGVHASKPSKADATKAVPEGHTAAIVRV